MAFWKKYLLSFFLGSILFLVHSSLLAQNDSLPRLAQTDSLPRLAQTDSLPRLAQTDSLRRLAQTDSLSGKKPVQPTETHKDFFSKMIKPFRKDTTQVDHAAQLKRNDQVYTRYENRIIRTIYIEKVPFGTAFADTSKKFRNGLITLANDLHHITRTNVIRNNLFFKENDRLKPYLMADNERFLRQLPYLQDAGFIVVPVAGDLDSVDIIVVVKDVFSLGGAIGNLGIKQSQVQGREDNFAGTGNAAVLYGLYDNTRKGKVALGGEYDRRNIGGSFIDGTLGYQSFYPSIGGPRQDNIYYVSFSKPLINRYMKWTYELDASYNSTRNFYLSDSLYSSTYSYRYSNVEAWAGYNINSADFTNRQESDKLRKVVELRFIDQKFQEVPTEYSTLYNWRYADLMGLLATVTFYRQNFYKTQYIYGFGRNEDIPEGLLLEITSGYTIKQSIPRPFIGFNFERDHYTDRKNYLSFIVRAEGYLDHKSIEDINLLTEVDYFDHLKAIGTKWKQRFFLNVGIAQQVNSVLNEPLFANSQFGLPEYGTSQIGGTLRATAKAQSVFFSPWSLASFKFAPFIFSDLGIFAPYLQEAKFLSSVGGGIRTRNESFIFGTIEIKGYYFPQGDFYNEKFSLSISTNVIFKYTTQFVKKPDFIQVN